MLVSQGAGPSATVGPYTGPAAAPAAPTAPTPTHTSTPVGGIQPVPGGTTVPVGTPPGGGFTGTPTQSAAAAYVGGLTPNTTDWQTAVSTANANHGTIPGIGGAPAAAPTVFDTDPGALWAKQQEQLGIPKINTDLQSLISRIVANYGDPSIASMAGFGLDPQSAAFAQQNYLSGNAELARIDAAHKQNQQKIINQLAGHGLVFSGDTGYQTGLENQSYGNTVYDAQQQALTNIINAITAAQQQKDTLHQATVGADESAWQQYVSNPQYWANANGLPSQTATNGSSQPSTATAAQVPSAAKQAAASVVQRVAAAAKKKTLPNAYVTGQKKTG